MVQRTQESQLFFYNLGSIRVNQGKLEESLSMDQESLEMKRAIYGHDKAYPEIWQYRFQCNKCKTISVLTGISSANPHFIMNFVRIGMESLFIFFLIILEW